MHYKYLQISRVCSLFNRRRRRPEDVDTRSRVRQRDKESRTVIRSMPSTRIRFHMCACTRGRCSDRMLSMHHVAARSHEWILEMILKDEVLLQAIVRHVFYLFSYSILLLD